MRVGGSSGSGGGGGGGKVGPSDVVFVDPAGNDASGQRGNAAKPFLTVRAAVAAMTTPGDMVSVAPGIFDETAGGGTITAPIGVTRWGIIGWGRASSDEGGNPTGTLITHKSQDLFTLRATDTGFSFQNITLSSQGANKRAIVADGTGGAGACMTAGLVGTDATLLAPAGFFLQDLGVVDMRDVEVAQQTSGAQLLTCSKVRLCDVLISTDLTLAWNAADASAPAAGRVAMVLQSLRVLGTLTLDRQVKIIGDAGCKISNLVGGANLVVAGGLALSQVWDGSKFGTFQGADGLVDFSTNPIPDFAGLVPNGFFGCQFLGSGLITFDTPGVNRQRVSLDNSTVDNDNAAKTIHAGRAIDVHATNLSLGPGVLLTSDPSSSFGQRLGIVNATENFFGGQRVGDKRITHATGAYTLLEGDYLVLVDTGTGTISDITLTADGGAPTNVGRTAVILDMGGNAVVNPFNVLAPGGGSINGAASVTVNQNYGGLVVFSFDGLNYFTPACCGSISGAFSLTSVISPAQIVAMTNDYAPTGFAGCAVMRTTSDANRNVTGLAGGTAGRQIEWFNVGSFAIILTNEDAASAAANRFTVDGGGNCILMPNTGVELWYDGTSSRWRVFANKVYAFNEALGPAPHFMVTPNGLFDAGGGVLGLWADESGLAQVMTPTASPTIVALANGRNGVQFNGTTQFVSGVSPGMKTINPDTSQFEFVVVVKPTAAGGGNASWFNNPAILTDSNVRVGLTYFTAAGVDSFQLGVFNGATTQTATGGNAVAAHNSVYIVRCWLDPRDQKLRMTINNGTVVVSPAMGGLVAVATEDSMQIAKNTFATLFTAEIVGEVRWSSRMLTTYERQRDNADLTGLWNIVTA